MRGFLLLQSKNYSFEDIKFWREIKRARHIFFTVIKIIVRIGLTGYAGENKNNIF
jgi:hypothetical protein